MVMDFQTRQDQARQNTARLVALLAMGVLAIVVVVSAMFAALASYTSSELQPLDVVIVVAPVTAIAVIGTSLFKSSQIRNGGGTYVATSMGGRKVDLQSNDPVERRLIHIVEEIAIASGAPVPGVFVLDAEPSINAFAAGWSPDQAAIGVTKGALLNLDRHELQGVIAHEFSHLIRGDTQIKTRIIGWVFGIAALTVLGRVLMYQLLWAPRRRGRDDRTGLVVIAAGIGLLVIGAVGTFFARLVQAAVSRQREYLADASAVQYTRDPSGLASALEKIGGFDQEVPIRAAHATESSHLFFASVSGVSLATHPPLKDRIRRLLPDWDGHFIDPDPVMVAEASERTSDGSARNHQGRGPRPGAPFPWLGPPPPGRRPPSDDRRTGGSW